MNHTRLSQRIAEFRKAVQRLEAACRQPKDEFIRDSVIQRFEFCYELAWKMLKLRLAEEDIDVRSPKATLQAALEMGLIDDGNAWTELHRVRNLTTHTYDESLAEEVYTFVCRIGLPLLQRLAQAAETWKR